MVLPIHFTVLDIVRLNYHQTFTHLCSLIQLLEAGLVTE